ncbi:MAG: cytochrome P450, partial [Solirubrobacteraceae bacterium]|nr:cytochrome P450 [Solirubrobacteraceae bacterium]
ALIVSHPDHLRSLFTAKPELAPSFTSKSPLRPIVGPNSTLTAVGPRHMRQRKLLLPSFHGESIARYIQMIEEAADREIDRWPMGKPFALAPRMQAITLDVIMSGIFGIEGRPKPGSSEWALRTAVRVIMDASTQPLARLEELVNNGRDTALGGTRVAVEALDRVTHKVISERRRAGGLEERTDIMSMLMQARTEDGEALTDTELRDELLTLVLAGHETTANSLSWAWERLTRTPEAHDRLIRAVRSGDDADTVIEQTVQEVMRTRPVVPAVPRKLSVPWQFGEYGVPAGTPVGISILLAHHREDVYVDPFAFRPERWIGNKPGTYTWIPFGGGIRRCLGASMAMAEIRVVLKHMAERLDLEADRPEPEHAMHRNVTMIPARGGRVVARPAS